MSDTIAIERFRSANEFLGELVWAVRGIPSEVARQWRDAHRWDRAKGSYDVVPDGNHQSLVYTPDPDYLMWRKLGRVTDALLVLIAPSIVLMIVLAVL